MALFEACQGPALAPVDVSNLFAMAENLLAANFAWGLRGMIFCLQIYHSFGMLKCYKLRQGVDRTT